MHTWQFKIICKSNDFSSPLRYTCVRRIGGDMEFTILCAVFDCIQHISVKYNFVITVLCCASWYCCTIIRRIIHYIAFQFYTLFFKPEWCAAVCCTVVVRPQKGVPWNEPFTSFLNCYTTLQPSVFPLTLPAVELVVITFMILQQFGFVGECKCN